MQKLEAQGKKVKILSEEEEAAAEEEKLRMNDKMQELMAMNEDR